MVYRCAWVNNYPESHLMTEYHDNEWGRESHNIKYLYEMLVLELFQAGLSWSTIINKRDNFREAFLQFDYKKVAKFSQKDIDKLLQNEGIIRNRLKVEAAVNNAKKIVEIGDFDKYIWDFNDGKKIDHKIKIMDEIPPSNELSDRISKQMKKDGFKFVGGTIMYSFIQAIGMVNDHEIKCDFNPDKRKKKTI